MIMLWIGIMIVFLIIEGMTAQFVSIWFAISSIISLILSLFKVDIMYQILSFAIVSLILIISTKPLVKKHIHPTYSSNADSLIGKTTIVIEDIDNLKETGTVKLNGVEWSARSLEDDIIPKGEKVIISKISGVRVLVSKVNVTENI